MLSLLQRLWPIAPVDQLRSSWAWPEGPGDTTVSSVTTGSNATIDSSSITMGNSITDTISYNSITVSYNSVNDITDSDISDIGITVSDNSIYITDIGSNVSDNNIVTDSSTTTAFSNMLPTDTLL